MAEVVDSKPRDPIVTERYESVDFFFPAGLSEIYWQNQVTDFAPYLEENPVYQGMGYEYSQSSEGIKLTMPSTEGLNDLCIELEIYDRGFVAYEGKVVPPKEYVAMIADGRFPISTDPYFRFHDTRVHALGIMTLPKRALDLIKSDAKRVLETGDEDELDKIVNLVDYLTVLSPDESKLRRFYEGYMNKSFAAILANKDSRDVKRIRKILAKAQSHQKFSTAEAPFIDYSDPRKDLEL